MCIRDSVTRIREASGTWSTPEVVDLGTGDIRGQTFDTYVDPAGRLLAVWAVKSATSGQWPVWSVFRNVGGTWDTPREMYVAQTDGAFSDSIEVGLIRPRLTPQGSGVTLAWSTVQGAANSRVDVSTDPFRARRWADGGWGRRRSV